MTELPWRPTRRVVLLIGLLSAWPIVYMALFLALFAYTWLSFTRRSGAGVEPLLFRYIFPLHCFTILLMFLLMGVYVFHAYKTDRFPSDKKVLWVVILFFGNVVAFPIYWYLYMWRSVPPTAPPADALRPPTG